LAHPQKEI